MCGGMCGVDGRVCELMLEIARVVLKFITMEILFSRRLQNVYYNYPTHATIQQLPGFPTVVMTTIAMETTVQLTGLSGGSIYRINVSSQLTLFAQHTM